MPLPLRFVAFASLVVASCRAQTIEAPAQSITVTADVKNEAILSPDLAAQVFGREQLLNANPGRPGVPVSIPGYPAESASGGLKAPQYFAPGVAGDHGEHRAIPPDRRLSPPERPFRECARQRLRGPQHSDPGPH